MQKGGESFGERHLNDRMRQVARDAVANPTANPFAGVERLRSLKSKFRDVTPDRGQEVSVETQVYNRVRDTVFEMLERDTTVRNMDDIEGLMPHADIVAGSFTGSMEDRLAQAEEVMHKVRRSKEFTDVAFKLLRRNTLARARARFAAEYFSNSSIEEARQATIGFLAEEKWTLSFSTEAVAEVSRPDHLDDLFLARYFPHISNETTRVRFAKFFTGDRVSAVEFVNDLMRYPEIWQETFGVDYVNMLKDLAKILPEANPTEKIRKLLIAVGEDSTVRSPEEPERAFVGTWNIWRDFSKDISFLVELPTFRETIVAGGLGGDDATAQSGTFALITVSVKNDGKIVREVDFDNFLLADSQGRRFGQSLDGNIAAARMQRQSINSAREIQPGLSVTRSIVFQVPVDAVGLHIEKR